MRITVKSTFWPENPLLNGSDLRDGEASFDKLEIYRYQNRRSMSSTDRAVINSYRHLASLATRMSLPQSIVDRAHSMFKKVYNGKNLKGKANDSIATACLYTACRLECAPRTFKEICTVSKTAKREIGRCYRQILKVLDTSVSLLTTEDFMTRFCSNLGLSDLVRQSATHIARKAVELDIVPGRSPSSVTAAAIYMASMASGEKRWQKEIGEVAGVADVTIRQSYKIMYPHAHKLFSNDFKFFTCIEDLPPY